MAQIGSFALLLAFALSVYSFGGGLVALLFPGERNWERLGETARRAGIVVFGAVVLAAIALVVSAFRDDFTIAYVFHHSNRELPGPYKFATLWSGQEGSLLFWSLLLAGYGFVLRLRYKTDPRLFAYASVVLAAVQIFFLALVNFAANPFGLLEGPLRAERRGRQAELVVGAREGDTAGDRRVGAICARDRDPHARIFDRGCDLEAQTVDEHRGRAGAYVAGVGEDANGQALARLALLEGVLPGALCGAGVGHHRDFVVELGERAGGPRHLGDSD